jgi:hypothetical protein
MNLTIGQCKFQVSHCTSQDSPLLNSASGAVFGWAVMGLVRKRSKQQSSGKPSGRRAIPRSARSPTATLALRSGMLSSPNRLAHSGPRQGVSRRAASDHASSARCAATSAARCCTTRKRPWQCAQVLISILRTRFTKASASSCACALAAGMASSRCG